MDYPERRLQNIYGRALKSPHIEEKAGTSGTEYQIQTPNSLLIEEGVTLKEFSMPKEQNDRNTVDHQALTSSHQRQQQNGLLHRSSFLFQLVYLPKYISKEDVLQKLSKFGPLSHFRFSAETEEKLGSHRGEKAFFHRAEFSFEQESDLLVFMAIKRLRIKGLQLKVVLAPYQRSTQFNSFFDTKSRSSFADIDHSLKPTKQGYFKTRTNLITVA